MAVDGVLEIGNAEKLVVLQEKIEIYKKRLYSLEVDVKVAQKTNEPEIVEAARAHIKNIMVAIDVLEDEKGALASL